MKFFVKLISYFFVNAQRATVTAESPGISLFSTTALVGAGDCGGGGERVLNVAFHHCIEVGRKACILKNGAQW